MSNKKILVVGGSGVVGSEIIRILREQGHSVRATSSKAGTGADGVEKVQVNLQSGEGLREAFEGIDRAFFLSPSGYGDQYGMLAPLIQEAKRRGLEKVVLMTAMGANAVETTPMRRAEIDLEKSGLAYNIIRPNWFMQNFHTFWVGGIKQQGKIQLPAGDAKVSFVDTRDVSAVAAKLLLDDQLNNRDFDLTGSESLDHHEVAAAISKATGKSVSYQETTPDQLRQGLLGAGLPSDYTEFLLVIMDFLKQGYSTRTTENVQQILGRAPRKFAEYAADFRAAF